MASIAIAALDSILALRAQLLMEIDNAQEDPSQSMYSCRSLLACHRLAELEIQLRNIDITIGHVRIYLLDFHRTLASAWA